MHPERLNALQTFIAHELPRLGLPSLFDLEAITGDASFRKFYRLRLPQQSLVAVDAPPATENNAQYLSLSQRWRSTGLPLPEILAADLAQGFFLVSDYGDDLFGQVIDRDEKRRDNLLGQAIGLMQRIQQLPLDGSCPAYEESRFRMELTIFTDWFLGKLIGWPLEHNANFASLWRDTVELLVANVMGQARCTVHRDFHSRNLLIKDNEIKIIDYQDALVGPYVYDLVSLLRDCYRVWPASTMAHWQEHYKTTASTYLGDTALQSFARDFDLTGMQRHLKAIGIFARLKVRDGRNNYLADIPRVFDYIEDVTQRYPELSQWPKYLAQFRARLQPHL